MAPCTSSTCPRCGFWWQADTSYFGDSTSYTTVWPITCTGSTTFTRSAFEVVASDPSRRFDWFRDFETLRVLADAVPPLSLPLRIWRRLRGHDAGQVRRQKRRRFVQALRSA